MRFALSTLLSLALFGALAPGCSEEESAQATEHAEAVEIPEFTAGQFEFDIPKGLTQDGALDLTFKPGPGAMGVVVSEIWLIRTD